MGLVNRASLCVSVAALLLLILDRPHGCSACSCDNCGSTFNVGAGSTYSTEYTCPDGTGISVTSIAVTNVNELFDTNSYFDISVTSSQYGTAVPSLSASDTLCFGATSDGQYPFWLTGYSVWNSMTLQIYCHNNLEPCPVQLGFTHSCLPVQYEWETTAWSSCNQECGYGTQTRQATCELIIDSVELETVSNPYCTSPQPALSQSCINEQCTYSWEEEGWSNCPVECGGGTQTQSVVCYSSNGQPVSTTNCEAMPRPATTQFCNSDPCPGSNSDSDSSGSALPTGAIVGICVGAVAVAVGLGLLISWYAACCCFARGVKGTDDPSTSAKHISVSTKPARKTSAVRPKGVEMTQQPQHWPPHSQSGPHAYNSGGGSYHPHTMMQAVPVMVVPHGPPPAYNTQGTQQMHTPGSEAYAAYPTMPGCTASAPPMEHAMNIHAPAPMLDYANYQPGMSVSASSHKKKKRKHHRPHNSELPPVRTHRAQDLSQQMQ